MRSRAVVLLPLALIGVLFTSSGCLGFNAGGVKEPYSGPRLSQPGPAASPTPKGPPAIDELKLALQQLHAGSYRYTVDSNLPKGGTVSATGAFDPVAQLFEATTTITGDTSPGTYHRVVVQHDLYSRDGSEKTWIHLDLARLKKTNTLLQVDMANPTGLATFITKVATAARTGPHTYTGKFDATSSIPGFLPIGAPALWTFSFRAAPFTITTDEQGHISVIHMELPVSDGPTLVMTTTLSAHGTTLSIKAPAKANVQEAASFYYD